MRTIAIVVLYNPHEDFFKNVASLSIQVDTICVVDNSESSHELELAKLNNLVYFPQYNNLGIAKAQNVGIEYAIENKFEFILFSDPDSFIPNKAVDILLSTYLRLRDLGIKVGSVGSSAINQRTGIPFGIKKWNYLGAIPEEKVIEVTYTMNSISLIQTHLFEVIGMMDESLFIDGVDNEWCWRARKLASVRFFVSSDVVIEHNLGRKTTLIFNHSFNISTPKRLYYQYRNYFLLSKRDYVQIKWIRYNAWKYLLKIPYYSLFITPRWKNFKNIIKGIYDGIKNKVE